MIDSIKRTVVTFLYHIQVTYSKPVPQAEDHLQGLMKSMKKANPSAPKTSSAMKREKSSKRQP